VANLGGVTGWLPEKTSGTAPPPHISADRVGVTGHLRIVWQHTLNIAWGGRVDMAKEGFTERTS